MYHISLEQTKQDRTADLNNWKMRAFLIMKHKFGLVKSVWQMGNKVVYINKDYKINIFLFSIETVYVLTY